MGIRFKVTGHYETPATQTRLKYRWNTIYIAGVSGAETETITYEGEQYTIQEVDYFSNNRCVFKYPGGEYTYNDARADRGTIVCFDIPVSAWTLGYATFNNDSYKNHATPSSTADLEYLNPIIVRGSNVSSYGELGGPWAKMADFIVTIFIINMKISVEVKSIRLTAASQEDVYGAPERTFPTVVFSFGLSDTTTNALEEIFYTPAYQCTFDNYTTKYHLVGAYGITYPDGTGYHPQQGFVKQLLQYYTGTSSSATYYRTDTFLIAPFDLATYSRQMLHVGMTVPPLFLNGSYQDGFWGRYLYGANYACLNYCYSSTTRYSGYIHFINKNGAALVNGAVYKLYSGGIIPTIRPFFWTDTLASYTPEEDTRCGTKDETYIKAGLPIHAQQAGDVEPFSADAWNRFCSYINQYRLFLGLSTDPIISIQVTPGQQVEAELWNNPIVSMLDCEGSENELTLREILDTYAEVTGQGESLHGPFSAYKVHNMRKIANSIFHRCVGTHFIKGDET